MTDFACLYERFDPAIPLSAQDPAYVDWQAEVLGTDVKSHRTRRRPEDENDLQIFYDLLGSQYVFSYSVGKRRYYDWNPLLELTALAQQ